MRLRTGKPTTTSTRTRASQFLMATLWTLMSFTGAERVSAFEPVTPTPADLTYAQVVKLVSTTGKQMDELGRHVAISGDWAIAGAPGRNTGGFVNVYHRAGGVWSFHQKLTAGDPMPFDFFGSVAIDGTTIVVGAPRHAGREGAAYIFTLSGNTWTQQQKLTSGSSAKLMFGTSVAISGETLVVGAPTEDFIEKTGQTGAAYVFVRSGSTWTQQLKLEASDLEPFNKFGRQVLIDGDTMVIASHRYQTLPDLFSKVRVYTRTGTTWTEQQLLSLMHAASLAGIDGDTLVIGTYGVAHIYQRAGTNWALQQEISTPDSQQGVNAFDGSAAFSGDHIVLGTTRNSKPGTTSVGAAYIYSRTGSAWEFTQKVVAKDGGEGNEFGCAIGVSGDTVLIGSRADIGENFHQGAAYIFDRISNNAIPTIVAAAPISIQEGEILNNVLIATVSDVEDAAGTLKVESSEWVFNDDPPRVSNVVNIGGQIFATVNASVNTPAAGNAKDLVPLSVFDSQFAVSSTNLKLVISTSKPTIGTYPDVVVFPGDVVTVTPSEPPMDNGPFTLKVFSFGFGFSSFDGQLSINQTTGAVTVANATPGGTYKITVSMSDSASTITRSFLVTAAKYEAPPVMTSSANPSVFARPVTFTVAVAAPRGAPIATGYVLFLVDGAIRGLPVPLVRGAVQVTTSTLSTGAHRLTAVYSGDRNYKYATTSITQIVGR